MPTFAKLVQKYAAGNYGGQPMFHFAYELAWPAKLPKICVFFKNVAKKYRSYQKGKYQINLRFPGIKAKNGWLKSRQFLTYAEMCDPATLAREFEYTQISKEMAVDVTDLEVMEVEIKYFIDE